MKRTMTAVLTVAIALCVGMPAHATNSQPPQYSSCSQLTKTYPNGIAKTAAAASAAVKSGYGRPAVSRAAYMANAKRLDRDNDGVICPRKGGQPAGTKATCTQGAVGYTITPGEQSFPIAVQLTNSSPTEAVGDVEVSIAVIDANNVIVETQRTSIAGIPPATTTWAATEVYLSNPIPATAGLTPKVTITCSPGPAFARGILTGAGSAIGSPTTSTRLEATIRNTSDTVVTKYTDVTFVAFDAAGNPLGGDSTDLPADVAPGMGIVEHITIPVPSADKIATVQYFVDPQ